MKTAKVAKFNKVRNVPLEITAPITKQDIVSSSVTPDKFVTDWQPFYNPISNYDGGTLTAGGDGTVNGLSNTPNIDYKEGNAGITARYYRLGYLVVIYVRYVIGSTTVINALTENGSGQRAGRMSLMAVNLPFPAAAGAPYALGTYRQTASKQNADNSINFQALQNSFLLNTELPGGSNCVLITDATLGDLWSHAPAMPATYNANGFTYWTPGDYFELQLEYETDYDG